MRVAALDLGSNSFHLVVADVHPDRVLEPVVREKDVLRLGDLVGRYGALPNEDVERAVASARRLAALAEAAGAVRIVAAATSALRDAANGSDVVAQIEAACGLDVAVIDGDEEARLIFEAVRASVLLDRPPALCLDLGGGSLEVMVGDADGLLWSASKRLGVGRLTAEIVHDDPPTPSDLRRLRQRVEAKLAPIAEEVDEFEPGMLVGTSGTLCALARLAAARRDGTVPTSFNQLTVSARDLESVHREIVRSTSAQRQQLPGIDARRADLLPAGSTLLAVAMDLFGVDELTVSEWALREGMVLDASRASRPVAPADPRSLRQASVLALCRRCRWDEGHGRQVERLATELFDQTRALHELGPVDRELLAFGAWLHDIGEHVAAKGHDRHGAYLVQHGQLRGFDPAEVAILASLTRFHLRGTPKPFFEPLRSLPDDARRRVVTLTALLRVADGLDRSKRGAVQSLRVELGGRSARLFAYASVDVELELWSLQTKAQLFERVFGRALEVRACIDGAAATPLPSSA